MTPRLGSSTPVWEHKGATVAKRPGTNVRFQVWFCCQQVEANLAGTESEVWLCCPRAEPSLAGTRSKVWLCCQRRRQNLLAQRLYGSTKARGQRTHRR
eukprot:1162136-Pelagomonas_calceolata.AAC.16